MNVDTDDLIKEEEALQLALGQISADEFAWENSDYETALIIRNHDESSTWYPKGKLFICDVNCNNGENSNFRLVWEFQIFFIKDNKFLMNDILIDAKTLDPIVRPCLPNGNGIIPPIDLSRYIIQTDISDEFTGPAIDVNKWVIGNGEHICWDHSLSLDQSSNLIFRNVSDGNGTAQVLTVLTKKEQTSIPYQFNSSSACSGITQYLDYSTASCISKEDLLYGYYEIRAKFPNLKRDVSQDFWMFDRFCEPPLSNDPLTVYSEIDIFEHFPWTVNQIDHVDHPEFAQSHFPTNIHHNIDNSCDNYCLTGNPYNPDLCIDLSRDFHTYAIEWKPNSIGYFFDDHPLLQSHSSLGYIFRVITQSCLGGPHDHNGQMITEVSADVSDLSVMKMVFGQSVRPNSLRTPQLFLDLKFDIDYIRYHKRRPDIIPVNNSLSACVNEIKTFNAEMYGITTTVDQYTWSVSSNATFIGSNTNNSCTIQINSGTQVVLSVVAKEAGTSYKVFNIPRFSSNSLTITLITPQAPPQIVLATFGSECTRQVVAYNQAGSDEYYFKHNNGSWVQGYQVTTTVFGITDTYWTDGITISTSNLPETIKCYSINCAGNSSITTTTFNSFTQHPCDRLASRIHKQKDSNTFLIIPNIIENITEFKYILEKDDIVSLEITDMYGKIVEILISREKIGSGEHTIVYSSQNLQNGIYLSRLTVGHKSLVEKFIVLR